MLNGKRFFSVYRRIAAHGVVRHPEIELIVLNLLPQAAGDINEPVVGPILGASDLQPSGIAERSTVDLPEPHILVLPEIHHPGATLLVAKLYAKGLILPRSGVYAESLVVGAEIQRPTTNERTYTLGHINPVVPPTIFSAYEFASVSNPLGEDRKRDEQ
jgi:hypothetical protein